MQFAFQLILVFSALNLLACSDSPQSIALQEEHEIAAAALDMDDLANNPVIASNGKDTIRLSELDAEITLKKFDLEWALYELRLAALSNMTELNIEADSPAWSLTLDPPWPPRIDLPLANRYIIGDEEAPIKISIFCSYQSSPCMRVQPVLKQIEDIYGALVSFIPFDYPMHFHRNGLSAANAARCAAEQKQLPRYQQGLYAAIEQLNEERYFAIAEQLGLNTRDFKTCFDTRKHETLIQRDIELAKSLNTGNVPIIFINGLYTKGPKTVDTYVYYIERELMRLGIELSEAPNDSEQDSEQDQPEINAEDSASEIEDDNNIDSETADRVLPVSASMTLSREWVDTHLLNQSELEKSFKQAEHLVNHQFHLMRLENIEETDFYKTLGLKERDVIMQVNGDWLHSGQNTLWDTLHSNSEVSIVLMRKGLPYRYDFQIE